MSGGGMKRISLILPLSKRTRAEQDGGILHSSLTDCQPLAAVLSGAPSCRSRPACARRSGARPPFWQWSRARSRRSRPNATASWRGPSPGRHRKMTVGGRPSPEWRRQGMEGSRPSPGRRLSGDRSGAADPDGRHDADPSGRRCRSGANRPAGPRSQSRPMATQPNGVVAPVAEWCTEWRKAWPSFRKAGPACGRTQAGLKHAASWTGSRRAERRAHDEWDRGHGSAARPETEPDKRGVGATMRRRDDTTFRARPSRPKRRLTVYEP